jgi:predicted nucleotidyltransferase
LPPIQTGFKPVNVDAPRRAVSLEEVRSRRADIERLGLRYGIRDIRVFGSVVRGEANASSDLDLLVEVERGHGYFDMAAFALAVEEMLGVFTQVATVRGLKLRIRERVLEEAVRL